MNIEQIGTSSVTNSISLTDYMEPYINSGDKEPCWDGHIYYYKNTNKSKSEIHGRAAVQVKAVSKNDLSKSIIKHPVKISDLRQYARDGGTVYFVVYVDKNGRSKIYYELLLPFNINVLLQSGNESSISLNFKAFPEGNMEKCNIIFNFILDRQKQSSSLDRRIMSIADAIKIGQFESFSFGYASVDSQNPDLLGYLFDHKTFVYGKMPGIDVKVPVDCFDEVEAVVLQHNKEVRVGDKVYYETFRHNQRKEEDVISFGASFSLVVKKTGATNFNYTVAGNLRERILDISFLEDLLEKKSFSVGEMAFPVNFAPVDIERLNPKLMLEHLEYLKTIQKLLLALGVREDLNYGDLTDEDHRMIEALISSILHKELVSLCLEKSDHLQTVNIVKISNIQVLLLFVKDDGGKFSVCDPFEKIFPCQAEDGDGNCWDTSAYMLLGRAAFASISNIDYRTMYQCLLDVPYSEQYHNQVCLLLLEMLHAYDLDERGKANLLECIIQIAEWQTTKNQYVDEAYAQLNYLQALLRVRDLKEKEIELLCRIIEQNRKNEILLVGAYLILGNQPAAKMHFGNLSVEEQGELRRFPIWKFAKWDTKV
ncbi:MAG: hypothetical protein PHE26_05360 [Syntrophomonadaceae bacterium]|nr:hypothetical protein [Syntrophomonadaceae bacterium]